MTETRSLRPQLPQPTGKPRTRAASWARLGGLATALIVSSAAASAGRPGQEETAGSPAAAVVRAVAIRTTATGTTVALHADQPLRPASVVRGGDSLLVGFRRADLAAVAGGTEIGTTEVRRVVVFAEPEGGGLLEVELLEGVHCDLGRPGGGLEIRCRTPGPPAALGESAAAPAPGAGAEEPAPTLPTEPGASGEDVSLPQTSDQAEAADEAQPVSFDLRDADLRDVLRLLSEVSGLDFVLQPGVAGRVSLRLTETPWDQALDVILRSQSLGHVLEGSVLRVGALEELLAERQERQRHREQVALTEDLVPLARRLDYVRPEDVRELLEARLSPRGRLIADARTGTLLVSDVALRIAEINTVLDVLDIPVPGVEIEARMVLATRSLSQRLGIRWGVSREPDEGETEDDADPAPAPPGSIGVDLPQSGAPTGTVDFSIGGIGGIARLDVELAAAERRGEVRILSAPRIVADNARPATIKQGVTFPVQVVANNTVTVQFQEAVLELTVTPHVSPAGTVLLEIQVSNDALDFGQAVNGIPSILTQNAATRARVDDGATAVLGGVFATRESEERGRVPFLARIPLLGRLFRSRETTRRDEELLIFLTPTIRATPTTYTTDLEDLPSLLHRNLRESAVPSAGSSYRFR